MIVKKNIHMVLDLDQEETYLLRNLLSLLEEKRVREHLDVAHENFRSTLLVNLPKE